MPGSRYWRRMNHHTQTPVNAVWFVMSCSVIAGLLGFSAAALTSLAGCACVIFAQNPPYTHITLIRSSVIGLYLSYVVPIFLRITSGRDKFRPGPFTLGKWSSVSGVIACSWVSFICVLLMFPSGSDPDSQTMSEFRLKSFDQSHAR